MKTPQFKSRDAMAAYAWNQVARRARMSIRFRKLRGGPDVRQSVIDAAVLRLLVPQDDSIDLLPKPLRKRMLHLLPAPIGNLQLHRSPTDAQRWAAFVKVHRQLFELGSFWSVTGEERNARVDQAIKKARELYISETRYCSPSADETIDQSQQENLSRLTEAGQQLANDPIKLFEQKVQTAAEENLIAAQRDLRSKVEAAEDARVCAAGVEYYGKLPRLHRPAFHAICAGESVDATIATRCGVARATVARIRATLDGLADQFQTLPPYEVEGGASVVEVPVAPDVPQAESKLVTRIDDISCAAVEEEAQPGNFGAGVALNFAEMMHIPEIDGADDSTLHIARRTDRVMGSRWGRGAKMFDAAELVNGNRYGGKFDDPANIALRAERELMMCYSESEMKEMQDMADKFGVYLQGLLKSAAVHRALRLHEAEKARTAARQLRMAAWLLDKSAEELADIRAFIAPFCQALGRSVDDLLGAMISPK
jgi:hypothetical protein